MENRWPQNEIDLCESQVISRSRETTNEPKANIERNTNPTNTDPRQPQMNQRFQMELDGVESIRLAESSKKEQSVKHKRSISGMSKSTGPVNKKSLAGKEMSQSTSSNGNNMKFSAQKYSIRDSSFEKHSELTSESEEELPKAMSIKMQRISVKGVTKENDKNEQLRDDEDSFEEVENQEKSENGFPYKHFIGNTAEIIELDTKYHGIADLNIESLIKYEIKHIINPCLKMEGISGEVKAYLSTKKEKLLSLKMPTDKTVYLVQIYEVEARNMSHLETLNNQNLIQESARIEKRLLALRKNEKAYIWMTSSELFQPLPTLITSMFKGSMASLIAKHLEKVQERRDQYQNLIAYIKAKLMNVLDEQEKSVIEARIEKELRPKVLKADEYIKKGPETPFKTLSVFLSQEMKEVMPEDLYGKSSEERVTEINQKIEVIKECKTAEENLIAVYEEDKDKPQQSTSQINKTREIIRNYNHYIDYFEELKLPNSKWIPVPHIKKAETGRRVYLKNRNIPKKALAVEFKTNAESSKKRYMLKWEITEGKYKVYKTMLSNDNASGSSNIQLAILSDDDLNVLDTKSIKVQIFKTSLPLCLGRMLPSKIYETLIPLKEFQTKSTIAIQIQFDGGVNCVLKIRKPLKGMKIPSLDSFITFPPFDMNAKVSIIKAQDRSSRMMESTNQLSTPQNHSNPLVLFNSENDALEAVENEQLPKGVSHKEVVNPDDPETTYCLGVLKEMAVQLEKVRKQFVVEMKREKCAFISKKWAKTMTRAIELENNIREGNIEFEAYIKVLKHEISKGEELENFYKRIKDQDRLVFIREKIKIMKSELGECNVELTREV